MPPPGLSMPGQASPRPSLSASAWSGLMIPGQLSHTSPIPSSSKSAGSDRHWSGNCHAHRGCHQRHCPFHLDVACRDPGIADAIVVCVGLIRVFRGEAPSTASETPRYRSLQLAPCKPLGFGRISTLGQLSTASGTPSRRRPFPASSSSLRRHRQCRRHLYLLVWVGNQSAIIQKV